MATRIVLRIMLNEIVSQDRRFIGKGLCRHFRGMGPIACLADFTV